MTALDRFLDKCLVRPDGFLPKERYTTHEFAELELERLWPRVWQIAGREEELGAPGAFFEYSIGDDSIVVVRTETGALAAFHNACLHRGTRLAEGCGAFAGDPDEPGICGTCGWLLDEHVEVLAA
jgi:hypothetical protein